jgi:hypothetical protein
MRLWNHGHVLLMACVLCLLGPAQGCPAVDGKDVVIGNEKDALFVGLCGGERTNCDRKVQTKSVGTKKPLECEPETGAALEVDWESEVMPSACSDSVSQGCQLGYHAIAIDDDGAAWVAMNFCPGSDPADADQRPCGIWLARYAADGTKTVGTTVVADPNPNPGHTQYRADVAVTSKGHGVVTVYSIEAENADAELNEKVFLAEYDKQGTAVIKTATLTGISGTHVAVAGDDSVVVASNAANNAHHGVLAEFGSDRALHFSQNRLDTYGQGAGSGVTGVSVNSRDRISVLMARDLEADSPQQFFAFSQFDRDGNMIWDRMLDIEFDRASWGQFGMDGDDDLVMLGHLRSSNGGAESDAMVVKLNSSGELLFAMHLPEDFGDHQLTVEPGGDNRMFVTSSMRGGARVKEISADGSRCVLHALPDGVSTDFVAGPGGSLYYLTDFHGPGDAAHFARLKAIESE